MKKRPVTTLFMLMSVDGKISSGADDCLDADRDWRRIAGVREGLGQYYALEQTTSLWSLNTGRVMAKIGVNGRREPPPKTACSFVIVDNEPHLTSAGVDYLCRWTKQLLLVTANGDHPALSMRRDNLRALYRRPFDMAGLLEELAERWDVEALTVQSGGTLNGELVRKKLLDKLDIVVAPLVVGGAATPTLVDGAPIASPQELGQLGALKLTRCTVLEHSYLRLQYDVLPQTVVE